MGQRLPSFPLVLPRGAERGCWPRAQPSPTASRGRAEPLATPRARIGMGAATASARVGQGGQASPVLSLVGRDAAGVAVGSIRFAHLWTPPPLRPRSVKRLVHPIFDVCETPFCFTVSGAPPYPPPSRHTKTFSPSCAAHALVVPRDRHPPLRGGAR